ncbi:unnamed protein product [Scytosiphon promiscuus]
MSEPASLADENPVAKAYRVWASTCPFAARSTMIGMVVSYLLSFFLPQLDMALRSSAYFTIQHFEVYRVVTTVFCSGGLLTVIFGLMTFNRVGPNLERSLGELRNAACYMSGYSMSCRVMASHSIPFHPIPSHFIPFHPISSHSGAMCGRFGIVGDISKTRRILLFAD